MNQHSAASPRPRSRARPFGRAASPVPFSATADGTLQLQSLSARQSSGCVCDPSIYLPTCPSCPKGQSCTAVLVPLKCGIACTSNTCTADSGSGGGAGGASAGGTIGGAVGGALGVIAVAGLLFLAWRQRARRREIAKQQARNDAKVRAAAGEKFRPGAASKAAGAGAAGASKSKRDSAGASSETRSVGTSGAGTSGAGGASGEDVDEEDVEYTELRPDGLTTYRGANGGDGDEGGDALGDLIGLGGALNRRYSTSAATHLSRISEGVEYEDDDDARSTRTGGADARSIRAGSTKTGRMSVRRKLFGASLMPAVPTPANGSTHSLLSNSAGSDGAASSAPSALTAAGGAHTAPTTPGTGAGALGTSIASSAATHATSSRETRNDAPLFFDPFGDEHEVAFQQQQQEQDGASQPLSARLLPIDSERGAGASTSARLPAQPSQAHRPTGAPLIALNHARNAVTRGADSPQQPSQSQQAQQAQQAQAQARERESGWYSPAAPSTAASRHFDFNAHDAERDEAYDLLRASGQHPPLPSASSAGATRASSSGAPAPGTPGALSLAPRDERPLSGTSISSGSSISADYLLESRIVTPATPGSGGGGGIGSQAAHASAKRVLVANGGRPELVRNFSSGSSRARVRSKRFNSAAATAGSQAGHGDEDGEGEEDEDDGQEQDPFDDGAAVRASADGEASRRTSSSGSTAQQSHAATRGTTSATTTTAATTAASGSAAGARSSSASFGIPILDGSEYAQGLPLHSFIDPRSDRGQQGSRLSWFDEDGHEVDDADVLLDEHTRPAMLRPGSVAHSTSGRTLRARDARQSTASSIGGLSVFDGIPFHVDHGDMPPNAAAAVAAARAAAGGSGSGSGAQRPASSSAGPPALPRSSLDADIDAAAGQDFTPVPRSRAGSTAAGAAVAAVPTPTPAYTGITVSSSDMSTGRATDGSAATATTARTDTTVTGTGTGSRSSAAGAASVPSTTAATGPTLPTASESDYSLPSAAPTPTTGTTTGGAQTASSVGAASFSSTQATRGSAPPPRDA